MKRLLFAILGTFLWAGPALTQTALAQDTIPLYSDAIARQQASLAASHRSWLGVDLVGGVWWISSAFDRAQTPTYYRPVSAIFYWPIQRKQRADKSAYVSVGNATYAGILQRTIYQRGSSQHLRIGIEQKRNRLLLGYGAWLANWSGEGSIVFKGPTFGNYQQDIGPLAGMAFGAEGYLGTEILLRNRLALRLQLRSTLLLLTNNKLRIDPPYLSGIDFFRMNDAAGLGITGNAWLVYRL